MMNGGANQHMVALAAIDGSTHRITTESARHGFLLDPGMKLQRRIKRSFRRPVGNQFKSPEKSATTDVTDVRMIIKARGQSGRKLLATHPHRFQQALVANRLLNGKRGGTGGGVRFWCCQYQDQVWLRSKCGGDNLPRSWAERFRHGGQLIIALPKGGLSRTTLAAADDDGQ